MTTRPLAELIHILDSAEGPLRPHDWRIVEAHQAGLISSGEARYLEAFARRSPKSQKRALADSVPVTDQAVADMRAKLADAGERLRRLRGGDEA